MNKHTYYWMLGGAVLFLFVLFSVAITIPSTGPQLSPGEGDGALSPTMTLIGSASAFFMGITIVVIATLLVLIGVRR